MIATPIQPRLEGGHGGLSVGSDGVAENAEGAEKAEFRRGGAGELNAKIAKIAKEGDVEDG